MKQYRNFGDERQYNWCAFCGGDTYTRDHVPSKILLDKPYPQNLPVVGACQSCNSSFSLDEEYIACWIDVAKAKQFPDEEYKYREKISKTLSKRPAIKAKILDKQNALIPVEENRLKNVFTKLAKGHSLFELNEPQFRHPSLIRWDYLTSLSTSQRNLFERPPKMEIFPEIGSRAFQKNVYEQGFTWQIVQNNRYRYLATANTYVLVRIVLSEFLVSEILWEHER